MIHTDTTARYRTVASIAEEFGVSRGTVWRWIKRGELPAVRVGPRNYRVRVEDVAAVLSDPAT